MLASARMDWRHPALPPLLRGLGTLLLVLASVLVGFAEYRQGAAAQVALERAHDRIERQASAAIAGDGVQALTREISLLRMQLAETDLAGQVFANPWFQLLGALGTLLVAASFFVEAAHRRAAAPPARAPDAPD